MLRIATGLLGLAAALAVLALSLLSTQIAVTATLLDHQTEEAGARGVFTATGPLAPGGQGTVETVWITGGHQRIRVAASIGPQIQALVAAAAADGNLLGGWGYRDHMDQHRLRRVNGCPNDGSWTHTDGEDPSKWASSSRCRVMTARPGSSQHETGLAVDFTCEGRRLYGTPCYRWLQANAATYGLYNLPGEPWHWSTTGR